MVALSPQGRQLDQELVEELAAEDALTLLSARFEGFDQRILDHLCTDVGLDRALRALGWRDSGARASSTPSHGGFRARSREGSGEVESFSAALDGGLEYPHYTRPAEFRGWEVPEITALG